MTHTPQQPPTPEERESNNDYNESLRLLAEMADAREALLPEHGITERREQLGELFARHANIDPTPEWVHDVPNLATASLEPPYDNGLPADGLLSWDAHADDLADLELRLSHGRVEVQGHDHHLEGCWLILDDGDDPLATELRYIEASERWTTQLPLPLQPTRLNIRIVRPPD